MSINGSIGYIYLTHEQNKILILSDNHSKLPYCNNENSQFISDWLNHKSKSKILLEEVPRTDTILKELWPSSEHTQKLKELYLTSKVIDGIDIRPFLIPFSWELLDDPKMSKELKILTLYQYFKFIALFYTLKHSYMIENLNKVYKKDYLESSLLGKHFIKIKNKTKQFIKDNRLLFTEPLYKLIKTHQYLFEMINDLISDIMEWYTIAKIFNSSGYNNFIIHAGLVHTSNINLILQQEYNYKIVDFDGLINLRDGDNYTNGCLKLPSYIDDQFGGGFGII